MELFHKFGYYPLIILAGLDLAKTETWLFGNN
jgi:hypothetical protein